MSDNVKKGAVGQNKPKSSGEKRSGSDRRKFSFGYQGPERRKNKDRRNNNDSD
jgi:hypothetical protein